MKQWVQVASLVIGSTYCQQPRDIRDCAVCKGYPPYTIYSFSFMITKYTNYISDTVGFFSPDLISGSLGPNSL